MWTSEQTMKFIDGLRSNPCLWDLTSLDYKNRNKKNDALATLGKEFGVDSHEVDKKIQSLKTQFRREHKKLLASKKSGCPIKSTWFGYESLLFLLQGNETKGFESPDIVQKEKKHAPVVDSEDEIIDQPSISVKLETRCCQTDDTSVGSFRAPLPKFKRSTTDDYRKSESCNCMKTSEKVKKRDDFSVYGEHVGNKLRSCGRSHFEISIAQHKIDDILFNLTMGVFEQNLHTNTECTPQFVYCQNYPHSTIHTSSSPAHNNEHYRSPSPSILSTSPSSNPPQSPQQNSHLFVIENIDSCSTPEFSGNHNNNP